MPINYMPQYMMGGMGQMGGINPINPMGVMNPMAGLGMPPLMGNLGPGGNITINYPQVSISAKDLLKRTLADRDEFMKLESSRFKRRIGDVLKYCIEETGVSTP